MSWTIPMRPRPRSLLAYGVLAILITVPTFDYSTSEPQRSRVRERPSGKSSVVCEPDGKAARIPFKLIGRHTVIPVQVNDAVELDLVLDTGMVGGLLITNPEIGGELGLEYVGEAQLLGAGGEGGKSADVAIGARFAVGGVEFEQQQIIVMRDRGHLGSLRADGVIGETVFRGCIVEIDYEEMIITLSNPATFEPAGAGSALELDFEHGKPFVDGKIAIEGRETIPVNLVVDLGAGHALSLNTVSDSRISPPAKTVEMVLGTGVSGDVLGLRGRIAELRLGDHTLKNVITSFPTKESHGGMGRSERNGNLGNDALRRFRVVFDYAHERMFLKKNSRFHDPFEINMAGLLLRSTPEGPRRVHDLIPESPAAAAGIGEGDRIVAVDGVDVRDLEDAEIHDIFTREGKEVRLTLEGDASPREVVLVLKRQL